MRRIGLAAAAVALAACVPAASAAERSAFGKDAPFSLVELPDSALRDTLVGLPPQARRTAIANLHRFTFPADDIATLRADRRGAIFYADPARPAEDVAAERALGPRGAAKRIIGPLDKSLVLKLHSKPGAARVVYLNFRGATVSGTAWNNQSRKTSHVMKPYTEDSDFAGLSQSEANTIAEVWLRVAEDYAPFDVDITTESPPKFGPQVAHVLFSPRRDASGGYIYSAAVGGVAYVGVWGYSNFPYYQPALVFPEGTGGAKGMAEAASHELGHNLGLSHDGTASLGYYGGHGSGLVSWGPLMGVGYYTNVTEWSKGEYSGANNTQDDIAIIAANLTVRADDHGNTADTATPLIVEGQQVTSVTPVTDPFFAQPAFNRGLVERASDLDVFSLRVGSDGTVDLTVTPAWRDGFQAQGLRSANLDVKATLYAQDPASQAPALGSVVATSDPGDDTYARIQTSATTGRYFLVVEGVGNGVPATGYSDYGSLGAYTITGLLPPGSETTVPLSVTTAGTGSGQVASSPAAIDCGGTCASEMPYKQIVTLTASPAAGSQFVGWSGACTGSNPICTVTMSAAKATVATFRIIPTMHLVSVTRAGSGIGAVTSSPAGINCGLTCSGSFEQGQVVTLTATPGAQTSFVGWTGACSGSSRTCQVTVGAAASTTATFASTVKVPVVVTRAGIASGVVTSDVGGLNCGSTCGMQVLLGTTVTLTATPTAGSVFAYWTGGCTGTTPTCTSTPAAGLYATAVFNMASGTVLTVTKTGNAPGTVTSAPIGLNCGSLCSAPFPTGIKVTVTAQPGQNAVFKGWTGACRSMNSTCTIYLAGPTEVIATFGKR